MSIRQKVKVRRGAAVAVAAVLALALAGCGGGDENPKESQKPSASQKQGDTPQKSAAPPGGSAAPAEVIATSQGQSGIVLEINSATRDQDGYLTVNGQIKNTGSTPFAQTAAWRGDEKTASPASVAGATVVDNAGKKRYYVLRDTEGRCACTTGLMVIKAGESVPFFAQFPAPPTNTTEVVFGLPTFAATPIKISG
ncbi:MULTISPECIES: hypothetical protein [Streptomyces]|uniref:hypothetical protein n=1 Tax=Streptomyces TaxID=1883 RepID=UPI0004C59360|nr:MULTISPECIES: hypothetical protein [Streptomyces]KOU85532.1 hypothetical protein ADK93_22340 [Streptomyces sp. XY58]KOV03754.1 hypothetical protein ADK89_25745 [Streptomyces sp. XY37]KOV48920.1 hypothetical protein ADK99_14265 [Streptomyces sp. MMG1064]